MTLFANHQIPPIEVFTSPESNYRMRAEFRVWHEGDDLYHIMFDQHEIVWSNGTATESLFTGPEALKTVSKSALAELKSLFPQIFETDYEPAAARPIPNKGKKVEKLLSRHKSNQKPFFNGISA